MAVYSAEYLIGSNNIVYKAKNFGTGRTIVVTIWNEDMVQQSDITLTELTKGLYYFPFEFTEFGLWHAVFSEDGSATAYHSFRIRFRRARNKSAKSWEA